MDGKGRLVGPAVAGAILSLGLAGCGSARREVGAVTTAASANRALQLQTFEHAWQRVAETYPHSDMKGLDWPAVRDELRPRAALATNAEELRPVIRDMLSRLGESHFMVFPGPAYEQLERLSSESRAEPGRRQATDHEEALPQDSATEPRGDSLADAGMDVRVLDGRVIVSRISVGGPAAAVGVRAGWELLAIHQDRVAELMEAAASTTPNPRVASYMAHHALVSALRGRPGSRLRLRLRDPRGGEPEVELTRRTPEGQRVGFGNLPPTIVQFEARLLPESSVGYVRFNTFLLPVGLRFTEAMVEFIDEGAEGLVLDLRGNPGGIGAMVMGMAGHLIAEKGQSLGSFKTREAELRFVANPRGPRRIFSGPVAILVDGLSASTSELLAAGLQGLGRARVFGTTSAGMALPSIIEELPNGDRLQFVTADLTAPDGTRIEGRGVRPDVEVGLDPESLLKGEDSVLVAALEWLGEARKSGAE